MICATSVPIRRHRRQRSGSGHLSSRRATRASVSSGRGRGSVSSATVIRATAPEWLQDVLDLPRSQRLVHDDRDRSGGERAEESRHGIGIAPQQYGDSVSGAHARVPQRCGNRKRARGERRVWDPSPAIHHGWFIPDPRCGGQQHVAGVFGEFGAIRHC